MLINLQHLSQTNQIPLQRFFPSPNVSRAKGAELAHTKYKRPKNQAVAPRGYLSCRAIHLQVGGWGAEEARGGGGGAISMTEPDAEGSITHHRYVNDVKPFSLDWLGEGARLTRSGERLTHTACAWLCPSMHPSAMHFPQATRFTDIG